MDDYRDTPSGRTTVRRGVSPASMRAHNEKAVLSVLREGGPLAGSEIAKALDVSAQTASVLVRSLLDQGVISKLDPVRGKVGKPQTPVTLNPNGVHSFGLNIGRRAAELVLVDFVGTRLFEDRVSYPFPTPDTVFPFLEKGIENALNDIPAAASSLAGIGVSMPFRLWEWHQIVQAPTSAMDTWRSLDVPDRVETLTGLETAVENDATSACIAEHLLGRGHTLTDFAYLFVGAFIGGGLVLDGKVHKGRTGNAGAFGALPVPAPDGGTAQLLTVASLQVLETALNKAGSDPSSLRDASSDWRSHGSMLDDWLDTTARNLAIACAAASSVLELEAVLIDGAMPHWVTADLVSRIHAQLDRIDMTGVVKPEVLQAEVGRTARSTGAALLPIHDRYFLN